MFIKCFRGEGADKREVYVNAQGVAEIVGPQSGFGLWTLYDNKDRELGWTRGECPRPAAYIAASDGYKLHNNVTDPDPVVAWRIDGQIAIPVTIGGLDEGDLLQCPDGSCWSDEGRYDSLEAAREASEKAIAARWGQDLDITDTVIAAK